MNFDVCTTVEIVISIKAEENTDYLHCFICLLLPYIIILRFVHTKPLSIVRLRFAHNFSKRFNKGAFMYEFYFNLQCCFFLKNGFIYSFA